MESSHENVIEFIENEDRACVTFTQKRYITKIEKLAKSHPEECEILARNQDGSICAHIPVKWVKVSPPRQMSEEQKQAAAERLRITRGL